VVAQEETAGNIDEAEASRLNQLIIGNLPINWEHQTAGDLDETLSKVCDGFNGLTYEITSQISDDQ